MMDWKGNAAADKIAGEAADSIEVAMEDAELTSQTQALARLVQNRIMAVQDLIGAADVQQRDDIQLPTRAERARRRLIESGHRLVISRGSWHCLLCKATRVCYIVARCIHHQSRLAQFCLRP